MCGSTLFTIHWKEEKEEKKKRSKYGRRRRWWTPQRWWTSHQSLQSTKNRIVVIKYFLELIWGVFSILEVFEEFYLRNFNGQLSDKPSFNQAQQVSCQIFTELDLIPKSVLINHDFKIYFQVSSAHKFCQQCCVSAVFALGQRTADSAFIKCETCVLDANATRDGVKLNRKFSRNKGFGVGMLIVRSGLHFCSQIFKRCWA